MTKINVYAPDDLHAKISEIAQKEQRSINFMSVRLLEKGLQSSNDKPYVPDNSPPKGYQLPEHLADKVSEYATVNKKSIDDAITYMIEYTFKERERQREKSARLRQKTT